MTRRSKVLARFDTRTSILSFATVLLLASLLFLNACNTIEGAGEDVENAADEVGDAID